MPENKENNNSGRNGNSSTFHQDGTEHRHANFTLETSATQPYDHDRMRGKPSNAHKDGADDNSKKTK